MKSFLKCLAISIAVTCAIAMADDVQVVGKVLTMSNSSSYGYIVLTNVQGPFYGRFQPKTVAVVLCKTAGCIDPSSDVQSGTYIEVKGTRSGDFAISNPSVIRVQESVSASALSLIQAQVVEVTPPVAGWQWLKLSNGKEVHVCASYFNNSLCPIRTGDIYKIGGTIAAEAVQLNATQYWQTEKVSYVSEGFVASKLLITPDRVGQTATQFLYYLGNAKVGQPIVTDIQINNPEDYSQKVEVTLRSTTEYSIAKNNCPPELRSKESCTISVKFAPTWPSGLQSLIGYVAISNWDRRSNNSRLLTFVGYGR